MEQAIPLAYLKRLESLYENWIANYGLGEVLVLDSHRLDFVSDLIDRHDVRQRIERLLPIDRRRR